MATIADSSSAAPFQERVGELLYQSGPLRSASDCLAHSHHRFAGRRRVCAGRTGAGRRVDTARFHRWRGPLMRSRGESPLERPTPPSALLVRHARNQDVDQSRAVECSRLQASRQRPHGSRRSSLACRSASETVYGHCPPRITPVSAALWALGSRPAASAGNSAPERPYLPRSRTSTAWCRSHASPPARISTLPSCQPPAL
jgi:hypothetical protein